MAVKQLPWKFLMGSLRYVRNTFYRRSPPDLNQLVVTSHTASELDHLLREGAYFEEAEEYTYKYSGEVLNLRRPAGVDGGYQMELHLRGIEHDDGLEMFAHYEISRFNHPREHLAGDKLSWDEGQRRFTNVLDRLDVEYVTLE